MNAFCLFFYNWKDKDKVFQDSDGVSAGFDDEVNGIRSAGFRNFSPNESVADSVGNIADVVGNFADSVGNITDAVGNQIVYEQIPYYSSYFLEDDRIL